MGELYVSAVDEGTTHHAIVRWHATTGWEVKDSKVLIDDQGNITQPGGATIQGKDVSRALLSTDDPLVIPAAAVNFTNPPGCTLTFKGAVANILADFATAITIKAGADLILSADSSNTVNIQTTVPGSVSICQAGEQCTVNGKFKVDSTGVINWDGSTLTFITPTIASMTNAQHDHADATGGGTLDASAIAAGTLPLARGGTGETAAQAAIDSLTAVSGATNEHVLTKDTASGNATFKVAAGGGLSDIVDDTTPQLGGNLDTNGNPITFSTTTKALFGDSGTFIHQSSDGNLLVEADILLTLGVAGDIELGDGTLRVMKPNTDNKIDLGTSALRFNKLFLSNDIDMEDNNIVLSTSTGTKIGTSTSQKLGFYNTTPVDQPATVSDAQTQSLTGFDTIDKNKTEFDIISCKNAINSIINRLKELGLIA